MKLTIVSDTSGEWEGLYVDGKLVYENHSLSVNAILQHAQVDFDVKSINMEKKKLGRLPETLEDLPL
jgi:hypothetical protein